MPSWSSPTSHEVARSRQTIRGFSVTLSCACASCPPRRVSSPSPRRGRCTLLCYRGNTLPSGRLPVEAEVAEVEVEWAASLYRHPTLSRGRSLALSLRVSHPLTHLPHTPTHTHTHTPWLRQTLTLCAVFRCFSASGNTRPPPLFDTSCPWRSTCEFLCFEPGWSAAES